MDTLSSADAQVYPNVIEGKSLSLTQRPEGNPEVLVNVNQFLSCEEQMM